MSSPPEREPDTVEPPFFGIIETTLDALIVFEASRRGLIPRITRRLAEKERSAMISSGSVFVFDEGESGIKRWTDGRIWSPSRILSNFLVYRETDKRADRHNPLPAAPKSPPRSAAKQPKPRKSPPSSAHEITTDRPHTDDPPASSSSIRPSLAKLEPSSPQSSFTGPDAWPLAQPHTGTSSDGGDSLEMDFGELASGAVAGIELGSPIKAAALTEQEVEDEAEAARQAARTSEKARERQLVGSLTTTYRFKEKGLVKKTISVSINGVSQHLVSYYSMEDALAGRLRSPSTVPELFALDISPDYLSNKHFRFPPKVEIGPDGVHRYRGEPDEPQSPPLSAMSLESSTSSTGRAPTSKAKRDPESAQARRPSKASIPTNNGGHMVGGPSTDSWQQTTPASWAGRPGSPMRQQARPVRPVGPPRRASEQIDYRNPMASPRWNGNQHLLQESQMHQQHYSAHPGYQLGGPSSNHHRPSPPPMSSSYQPPSAFQHETQFRPPPQQMYSPHPYPDSGPSVLARPMEIRRQPLSVGMERRESSDGSIYGVSPSRSSFQSSRNSRGFHPYAGAPSESLNGETLQFTQPTRRGSEFVVSRNGSVPPPLAGLPIQPNQSSPPEETPPLEPETDYSQYSYAPSYDPHGQPPTPTNGQPPSHHHPLPYHHPQYQLPTSYYQPPDPSPHSHQPPLPTSSDAYSTQPHPQSSHVYPPPIPAPQPLYYDPNSRGQTHQMYDSYGRPHLTTTTTMDPYAFQHQQRPHGMDDAQQAYASGMVANGAGAPPSLSSSGPQVKEEIVGAAEDLDGGYAWGGYGGVSS